MRYPEIVGFENVQINESSVYYRDIFEAVQHDIEDYRDEKYLHRYTAAVNPQPIFDFKDDDLWRYKGLIEKSRGTARAAIITIVKALMIKNNVVTYQPELHSKGDGYQTPYFDIVFKDKTNQKIGIRFFWDGQDAIPLDDLFDRIDKFGVKKEVEKIYFILLEHSYHKEQTESKDKRYYYNEYEYKQIEGFNKIADEYTNGFVRFIEFESFFVNWFGLEEYNKFIKAVESFNNRAKSLVGYKALFMPNKEEIDHLRIARFNELRQFDYKGALTNALNRLKNSINNTEFELLTAEIDNFHKICMDNYYNRLRLAVLVSDEDFSNSFISSEWYYDTSFSTDILDKTAIVVGYFDFSGVKTPPFRRSGNRESGCRKP